MKYISAKELAAKWDIDQSRIMRLAYAGRIEGATHAGKRWLFPANAIKPVDGRTKQAKEKKETEVPFRFPLYVNFDEHDYYPPLSNDEKMLRRAQQAFHELKYAEAKKLLFTICKCDNKYLRLSAYYHLLYIAVVDSSIKYDDILLKMNEELSGEFPYKKEMMLLKYGYDTDLTSYKSTIEGFTVDPEYKYHQTAYTTLTLVSFVPVQNGDFSLTSRLRYDVFELLCQQLEIDGYYLEAQKLNYLLAVVYQTMNDYAKIEAHIKKGLQLAYDHKLYFVAIFYARWYKRPTQRMLKFFPEDFANFVLTQSSFYQKAEHKFLEKRHTPSYITMLNNVELEYAFICNQGYSNREIADMKNISEKTVSRIFTEIYDKLGIKSRKELIDIVNATHG